MSAIKNAVTYYFAIVSLFSAVFLSIIGLMLLYDSDSLELHGDKSEKLKILFHYLYYIFIYILLFDYRTPNLNSHIN
ncbi:hypothetical protein PFBG_03375 [Plasmodium falciparum 7G8]|uniref:Uncharacterized protein n=1 Tax=Plasmodium falciparum (isolate 7G8) TaxID=57266 RepID=W7FK04_PLAF8|nr:hypothetical protein PFBG_03375 [Plasmodium falciparum 7G8]